MIETLHQLFSAKLQGQRCAGCSCSLVLCLFLFLVESLLTSFLLELVPPGLPVYSCSSCTFAKGTGRTTSLFCLETPLCVSEMLRSAENTHHVGGAQGRGWSSYGVVGARRSWPDWECFVEMNIVCFRVCQMVQSTLCAL